MVGKKNFGAYGHHSITADKNSRLKTFYLDGFRCRRLEGKLQDLGPLESRVPKCHRNPSNFAHRFCLSKIFLARTFLSLVLKNDRTFAKQNFKLSALNDAARWNFMMLTMVLYQHRAVNHFMITPRAILQWSSLDAREAICRSARAVIEEPQWK